MENSYLTLLRLDSSLDPRFQADLNWEEPWDKANWIHKKFQESNFLRYIGSYVVLDMRAMDGLEIKGFRKDLIHVLCPTQHSIIPSQWNLLVVDTIGTTWSVLIKEVSLFEGLFCTLLYVAGTTGSILIREVFLFRRSLIERFHCMYNISQT